MGKKLFLLFILLMLMLGSLTSACAVEQKDTSRLALDLVIALDMSSSMAKNDKQSNDMNGYRLDAAAIMLGLCDAEHSRAAIVPFAGTVLEDNFYNTKHFNKLYEINIIKSSATRTSMIKELNDDEMRRRGNADTGLGEALTRAVELLLEHPSNNHPVIVLMTDGKIDFSSNKATNARKIEASEKAYEEACQLAMEHGIHIYTVGLKGHGFFDGELLEQTAQKTGGLYHEITKASDLPEVFNSLYANEVGSNVVDFPAEMRNNKDGTMAAVLKVPNRSMAEANILIPVGKKAGSTVKLYKPNQNTPVTFDGQSIISYETKYFTLIKILKPQDVGEWRIEFQQDNVSIADVNIHVVFSYDVVPTFEFSNDKAEKQQEFNVMVKFREPNGENTLDENLYLGGIQANLELKDKDGNILVRSIPMNKTANGFSYTFVPAELVSNITSGKYYFTASMNGDGMDLLSTPGEMTVVNLEPKKTNYAENPFADVTIHDPTSDDYQKEFSKEIDLNTYVVDADKEILTFEIRNPQDLAFMETSSIKDGRITLTTKNMSGKTELIISASDPEQSTIEFSVPISVRNIRDEISNNYKLVFTVDEKDINKESEYHYTAKLMNGQTWVKDSEWLNLVLNSNLRVRKTYAEGKGSPKEEKLTIEIGEDGALHAKYNTELHECTYEVTGEAKVGDIRIELETSEAGFTLKNNPPILSGKGSNPFANISIHDPTTANYSEEYENTIDLSEYIYEPDGENIEYDARVIAGQDIVEIVHLDKNNGQLQLKTMNRTGEATLQITAIDEEGASVVWELPVSIMNVAASIGDDWYVETNWPEAMDKGQEYQCEAKVVFKDKITKGDAATIAGLLDMSGVQMKVYVENSEEFELIPLTWVVNEKGDGQSASFLTKDITCVYEITGQAQIKDIHVDVHNEPIKVGNIAPKVLDNAVGELQKTFLIEPLLWERANEDKYVLKLDSLFEDTPGDKLEYTVSEIHLENDEVLPDDASILNSVANGTVVCEALDVIDSNTNEATLLNSVPGNRVLLITAKDRDQEEANIVYSSVIISQKARVILLILKILACLVALIILLELYYWLIYRKAWTRAHGKVKMSVNGVPRADDAGFPIRGRADTTLNSLRIINASAGPGELRNKLNALGKAIKLRASAKGKVKVIRTGKMEKAIKVSVDGRNLSGNSKQLIWSPGGKMVIATNLSGNEVTIELKRENSEPKSIPTKTVKNVSVEKGKPSI